MHIRRGLISVRFDVIPPPPGKSEIEFAGCSHDGRQAAGTTTKGYVASLPILWRDGQALKSLGTLGGPTGRASGITADGRIVVGVADIDRTEEAFDSAETRNVSRPFYWDGQLRDLAEVTSDEFRSGVSSADIRHTNISADGTTVVGVYGPYRPTPFVWTKAKGLSTIELLPGANSGSVTAVSASGSVVVGVGEKGSSHISNVIGPYVWSAATGIRKLDFTTLQYPSISGNGRWIGWEKGYLDLVRGKATPFGPLPQGGQEYWEICGLSYDGAVITVNYLTTKEERTGIYRNNP